MAQKISNSGKKVLKERIKVLLDDKKMLTEKGKGFERAYDHALKNKNDHAKKIVKLDLMIKELEKDTV